MNNDPFLAGNGDFDNLGHLLPTAPDSRDVSEIWHAPDRHGFETLVADAGAPRPKTLQEMLKEDPDLLRDAREKDPAAWAAHVEKVTEQIALAFRQANPGYVKSERNSKSLVAHLLEKLGIDYLEGTDALVELHDAGLFTVETLTQAYRELLAKGLLDVPPGTARTLTQQELLGVVSTLRMEGADRAIGQYIGVALGRKAPSDYRRLMTEYPDLMKRAVATVFSYQRNLSRDTLTAFRRARLDGMTLPTLRDVSEAFDAWQLERAEEVHAEATRVAPAPPRDPRTFSDGELEEALATARRQHHESRRRPSPTA